MLYKKIKIAFHNLTLLINSNSVEIWWHLGSFSAFDREKIYCFRKALKINPSKYNVTDDLKRSLAEDLPAKYTEKTFFI